MTGKALVFGTIMILLLALTVSMLEFFPPLAAKSDMNIYCRSSVLKMEEQGCLSTQEKEHLSSVLAARGFSNISIQDTGVVRKGEPITLSVQADYPYNKLTGFLSRSMATQRMSYIKTTIARKVVN